MWTYIWSPGAAQRATFRADESSELMLAVRHLHGSGNKWLLLPMAAPTAGSLWRPPLCPSSQLGEGPAELQSLAEG